MKFLINHGQAMRSVFGRSRVTHFMCLLLPVGPKRAGFPLRKPAQSPGRSAHRNKEVMALAVARADVDADHRLLALQGRDRPIGNSRLPGERALHGCRSEEHTSELQSRENLVCRLLLEKKKKKNKKLPYNKKKNKKIQK